MQEFYTSYVATLRASLDRRSNPTKHAPFTHVRVHGRRVDISLHTINYLNYGADTYVTRYPLTPEFNYSLKLIKECHFK